MKKNFTINFMLLLLPGWHTDGLPINQPNTDSLQLITTKNDLGFGDAGLLCWCLQKFVYVLSTQVDRLNFAGRQKFALCPLKHRSTSAASVAGWAQFWHPHWRHTHTYANSVFLATTTTTIAAPTNIKSYTDCKLKQTLSLMCSVTGVKTDKWLLKQTANLFKVKNKYDNIFCFW